MMGMSPICSPCLPINCNLTIGVRFDDIATFGVDLHIDQDYTQIIEVNVLMRTNTYIGLRI